MIIEDDDNGDGDGDGDDDDGDGDGVTVEHPRSLANAHFLNLLKPFAKVLGSDLFHTIISSFLYATHILSTHLKFHTPYTF